MAALCFSVSSFFLIAKFYISSLEGLCLFILMMLSVGYFYILFKDISLFFILSLLLIVLYLISNFEDYWLKYQGQKKEVIVLNSDWEYIKGSRIRRGFNRRYLRVYFTENGKKVAADVVDTYADTFYQDETIQLYENPITNGDTLQVRVAKWRNMYFTELISR